MNDFYELLFKQLEAFYFLDKSEKSIIIDYKENVISRFFKCCKRLKNKYYCSGCLSPLHTCQYVMFLYYCANTIFKAKGRCEICDKIYGLSKIVSSADIYYEIELPEIFMFDHPVGTVLGRATYGNYFIFSQGCTVGNNKGNYPQIGNNVAMLSNSKVIGNSNIGDNVIISANTYVKDINVPNYSIVFGGNQGRDSLIIKKYESSYIDEYFNNYFKRLT